MKKSTGQTPIKSNIDIRAMFLAGVPKLLEKAGFTNKVNIKEETIEEKSKAKKRNAEEAFKSDEEQKIISSASKKRKTSNTRTDRNTKIIKTDFLTPQKEEREKKDEKGNSKSSKSKSKTKIPLNKKSSKGKSKKIIDDESEEYIVSNNESSEQEYKKGKKASAREDSDEDYNFDESSEENFKQSKKSSTKFKNTKETKNSIRNKKNSNSMDLDEEELEIINEQFKEMETEEIELKNKNNTRNNNNINSSARSESNRKEKLVNIIKKPEVKKIPNIIPECEGVLYGLTFVLTGVLELDRESVVNLLKNYGAKVTTGVSGKTSYLLYGDNLEDGRAVQQGNKFIKAGEKKVKRINQSEFEDLMREKLRDPSFSLLSAMENVGSSTEVNLGRVKTHEKNDAHVAEAVDDIVNNNQDLWATKHSPKDITEFVGNQKTISHYIAWLDDWHDVVINNNKKKVDFKMGKGKVENPNARACLISGDPGIGKTTVVRLIAKLKGYRTYELNASDQRNKAIISNKLGFLLDNKTLNHGEIETKNLIIMDEVDGMGGNEDRGGIAALIDVIKRTKVPIVCIANDKQNQKLRSLLNHCYDLKFNKPDKRHIVNRLQDICKKENVTVQSNALEYLCENVGNDIRQCINFLEFWFRKFNHLSHNDMTSKYNKFNKDASVMMSNFDAARKMLDKYTFTKLPFREKLDLFFIDYDLIPLLIQENYLTSYKDFKKEDLKNLVKATEHISLSDTIDKRIRRGQEWNLLPNMGIHSSLAVATYSGYSTPFPKFPELFGKMQKNKKTKREVKELKYSFNNLSSISIIEEVSPLVLSVINNKLIDLGKEEGVEYCLRFMRNYKLTMDKFKENIMDLQPNDKILSKYENITPQIKAYFTKKYNEAFKTSIVRKKRKDNEESKAKYDDEGNVIEEIEENEEEFLDDFKEEVSVKKKKEKSVKSKETVKSAKKNKK